MARLPGVTHIALSAAGQTAAQARQSVSGPGQTGIPSAARCGPHTKQCDHGSNQLAMSVSTTYRRPRRALVDEHLQGVMRRSPRADPETARQVPLVHRRDSSGIRHSGCYAEETAVSRAV